MTPRTSSNTASAKVEEPLHRLTPAITAPPADAGNHRTSGTEEIAAALDVTPEYLAFGVQPGAERIVYRSPERDNIVWLAETTFGESADDRTAGESFGFPAEYLRREFRANPESCIVVQVSGHMVEPAYEHGDRAIVDTGDVRPAPGGVFLYWDGMGATFANMQVIPSVDTPLVRVSGKGMETVELPLDRLRIIGRVKGRIHRS